MINVELIVEEQPTLELEVTEKIEQGGIIPSGTIPITSNGEYNVARYESADVNVPNTYTPEDEDKVVQNGQLVAQTPTRIDANGSYDTTTHDIVAVAVPNTYTAQDEGKVVDDGALVQQTSRNITQNDTYDTTLNNEVVVDVPNSYSASDEGKVVSNGALVPQTALSVTENGTFDTTLNNEVTVDVEPPDWVRPSEWPNLDLLRDDDYALYMTYDNTVPPTRLAVVATPNYLVERVQINSDGTVTVLDSVSGSGGGVVSFDIPSSAGDYPCYRVRGQNGANLTAFGLNGDGSSELQFMCQRVVERWFNLPNCTTTYEYAYRGWRCVHVEQETFVNVSNSLNLNMQDESSLRSLRVLGNNKLRVNSLRGNYLISRYPFDKMMWTGSNVQTMLQNNYALKEADLSDISMTGKNSIYWMLYNCTALESVTLPTGDYSSISAPNQAVFQNCSRLKGNLIFPETMTAQIRENMFAACYNLQSIVFLANSLLSLSNTNAFNMIVYPHQTVKVYVRQSLIEDYKVATNWSTLYNTNNNFLQPIEGSEFEYLLEEE